MAVTQTHGTMTAATHEVVAIASAHPGLNRIVLGIIRPGRRASATKSLKFSAEKGCVKITISAGIAAQEIRLYGTDLTSVQSSLTSHFEAKSYIVR